MRKTIPAWSTTSVSTVGAVASMAIADFRTVFSKIACPAILCLLYKERQSENEKCSDILRLFLGAEGAAAGITVPMDREKRSGAARGKDHLERFLIDVFTTLVAVSDP